MTAKNQILNVRVDKLGINGEGLATLPDGMKIFVPFSLTGEEISAQVLAVKKNFAYGKTLRVITPSPSRVQPECAVFAACGGCQLQHLDYGSQCDWKRALVKETFAKVGHLDIDVNATVTSAPYEYRNKIQLPVGVNRDGENVIGFYRPASHLIVDIDECPLHGEWAARIIAAVRAYLSAAHLTGYNELTRKGDVRHVVARYIDGRLLACIVTPRKELPRSEILVRELGLRFESFSLLRNVNSEDTNVILGKKTELICGDKVLAFEWLGLKIELAVESFLQVNLAIAERLYTDATQAADIGASVIIDAYSGAGIMTSLFARVAQKVYGVEICREAVADAIALAQRNNITNVEHIEGDCAEVLQKLVRRLAIPSDSLAVVLDPPRKGCDEAVLQAVLGAKPIRIVYVSCNPATLARDLSILVSGGYEVRSAIPYDMFPQTANVETLVVLVRTERLQ